MTTPFIGHYDPRLVALSVLIAILAAYASLDLAGRVRIASGRVRRLWLVAGAGAMGIGIWTMHYVGMEAFHLPVMMLYHWPTVVLSLLAAIAASGAALFILSRSSMGAMNTAAGSLAMGSGIAAMHYIGMAAMRIPARIVYSPGMVVLSVAAAIAISCVALRVASAPKETDRGWSRNKVGGAILLGLAIPAMHYIGMAAATFVPVAAMPNATHATGLSSLGLTTIVAATCMILGFVFACSTLDRHLADQMKLVVESVAERKVKDEALQWLGAIVESSEDAIIGKNDKGMVTSWNQGAEKIFGYPAAEMIGQSILRLLPADRQEEENEILTRLKRGETVDHFETVRVRKDGELIHVSLTISPIKDASGKLIGASKIARDITEQIGLERQRRQSQKMEALGNLTGGVAHDFNNLLGVIFGNLDLLERLVGQDQAALTRVHTAQKAASRGADLTRRLLAFSSNMGLKPIAVSLDQSIRNTIELTSRSIGPEIRITSHFADGEARVLVDASALESALINLIVNARDAMPKGGTITVSTEISDLEESYLPVQTGELKAGRYARVSLTDTGTGMSRETMQHAFEPYYTTKPRGKGTGLGLSMVYGFAKQTGGVARLYSEPGYGTTVTLYLPLAESESETKQSVAEAPRLAKRSGKVLVVDDELELLEIAAIYVRDMGYTAFQAKDGPSALEVIEQQGDIDLLVTDIIMPGGMNGVELAQRFWQRMPQAKVVYCSGFQADALEDRDLSLVDGPLLQKPYHRSEFEGMICRVMEGADDRTAG